VFFGKRYYNPSTGRWTTPDPRGFADGPNLYAYVHNNPLTLFDLYGEWSMRSSFRNGCDRVKSAFSSMKSSFSSNREKHAGNNFSKPTYAGINPGDHTPENIYGSVFGSAAFLLMPL